MKVRINEAINGPPIPTLVLKLWILTEKMGRPGFHVMREYAVDLLETTFVRDVMDTDIYTVQSNRVLSEALPEGSSDRRQRLYPVLDNDAGLVGVLPWSAVLAGKDHADAEAGDAMVSSLVVAHPDEILRTVADRMAALGLGVLPVVDAFTLTISTDSSPSSTFSPLAGNSSKKSATPNECSPCAESTPLPETVAM